MMTNKEYAEDGGQHCPHCGSGNLNAGETDICGSYTIFRNVVCGDCHKQWTEEFSLSGFKPDDEDSEEDEEDEGDDTNGEEG